MSAPLGPSDLLAQIDKYLARTSKIVADNATVPVMAHDLHEVLTVLRQVTAHLSEVTKEVNALNKRTDRWSKLSE